MTECAMMVTGGTGPFGRRFVETIITRHLKMDRVAVFSRDVSKGMPLAWNLIG